MNLMIKRIAATSILGLSLASCGNSTTSHSDNHAHNHEEEVKVAQEEAPIEPANEKSPVPNAGPKESTSVRQASQHVHGDAKLAIALDGQVLNIQLETPIYNLTGFEHAPLSEAQSARLAKVENTLSNPGDLFSIVGPANCSAASDKMSVDLGLAHEEKEDHEDHDDAHSDHEDDHKDVIIDYVYNCANPEAITAISAILFAEFPEMTELETVFLGPNAQLQSTLTPDSNRLNVAR